MLRSSTVSQKNDLFRPSTGHTHSSGHDKDEDIINPDDVPSQTKFFPAANADFTMLVQHSEAVVQVRKFLISEAIKMFPNSLNENCAREVQMQIMSKQRMVEKKFEEFLLQHMGFGTGECFEDKSMKILYKTFLTAPAKKMNPSGSTKSVPMSQNSTEFQKSKI